MSDDTVTYTVDELRDFKTGLDAFFDGQPDPAFEQKMDLRPSGWSTHFKLGKKLPSVTPNLTGLAQITNPALMSQLVDQLLDVMEAGPPTTGDTPPPTASETDANTSLADLRRQVQDLAHRLDHLDHDDRGELDEIRRALHRLARGGA